MKLQFDGENIYLIIAMWCVCLVILLSYDGEDIDSIGKITCD